MSKDPAFLFYHKDFEQDTADWEPQAIGWYVRLLCFQAGNGYIPADIEEIAQVARVKFSEYERFKEIWNKRVSLKFSDTLSDTLKGTQKPEKLINKKLEKTQNDRKNNAIRKSILATFGNWIKSTDLQDSEVKQLKIIFAEKEGFEEIFDPEKRKSEIIDFLENSLKNLKERSDQRSLQRTQQVNANENANENINTEEIENCYNSCLKFFPEQLHPKGKQVENWKETIEKLNRLDNIPFDKILEIVKKTREDDFWSKNFLSLAKLRKKNSEGIMYVVVFNEKIKGSTNYREYYQKAGESETAKNFKFV